MKYIIKYAHGDRDIYDSITELEDHVIDQYPDAVFYDCSGFEGLDTDRLPIMVWETEAESIDDDGYNAIGKIEEAEQ